MTRNRQIPGKPLSIEGFSNYNVNVLVARSFDPRTSIRAQFALFPIGLPVGNETNLAVVDAPYFRVPAGGPGLYRQLGERGFR